MFSFLATGFFALPIIIIGISVVIYLWKNFGPVVAGTTVLSFICFMVFYKPMCSQLMQQAVCLVEGKTEQPLTLSGFEWFCAGVFIVCMIANTVLVLRKAKKRH